MSHKKFFFFFFFFTFLHPTAPRNRENFHYLFFSKFRLKVPKKAAKAAQVSFFTNYLFSAVITRTHHLPTHTPFFRPIMCKKRALHLFLKINFFALYSFSLPPKHFLIIFSGKLSTKIVKSSLNEKKKFSFFYNLFHIFPLPLRKKTKPLTFSARFITGNGKTARENVP